MSTNITTIHSPVNEMVGVSSFSGGKDRGSCLQLTQRSVGGENSAIGMFSTVQMTRQQVQESVDAMQGWLDQLAASEE